MAETPEIALRLEKAADVPRIHALTQRAFTGRPYAAGDEQDVIDRLRRLNMLTLSLGAWEGTTLVGQITFSPAVCDDGTTPWFALGPVSVEPARQGLGIGGLLIRAGLQDIHDRGALGCILTGNPDYYARFGFVVSPEYAPRNEPPEFFMLHRFGASPPAGRFQFHKAFYEDI